MDAGVLSKKEMEEAWLKHLLTSDCALPVKGNTTHSDLQSRSHSPKQAHAHRMLTRIISTQLTSRTAEVRGEIMMAWYKNGLIHTHPEIKPILSGFFLAAAGKHMAQAATGSLKMVPWEPQAHYTLWATWCMDECCSMESFKLLEFKNPFNDYRGDRVIFETLNLCNKMQQEHNKMEEYTVFHLLCDHCEHPLAEVI